eukprot:369477-Amphidinium_carterae.1
MAAQANDSYSNDTPPESNAAASQYVTTPLTSLTQRLGADTAGGKPKAYKSYFRGKLLQVPAIRLQGNHHTPIHMSCDAKSHGQYMYPPTSKVQHPQVWAIPNQDHRRSSKSLAGSRPSPSDPSNCSVWRTPIGPNWRRWRHRSCTAQHASRRTLRT